MILELTIAVALITGVIIFAVKGGFKRSLVKKQKYKSFILVIGTVFCLLSMFFVFMSYWTSGNKNYLLHLMFPTMILIMIYGQMQGGKG